MFAAWAGNLSERFQPLPECRFVNNEGTTGLVRAIGRWSLAALVLNGIIGSGIFGLPSVVAGLVGRASPLAYLIAAAGIGVIMACFAEVASRFREAGGPYLYTQAAFGRFAGLQMGWLAWLVRLTSTAAGANLFVIYLAEFWPRAKSPLPRLLVISLLIGILAGINYRGVSGGATVSNAFALAKLAPLVAFILAGLFFMFLRKGHIALLDAATPGGAWLEALLVLVFAYGGFEAAMIPLGEARNPRRDAPFALFVALGTVTLVYTLVQVVVVGVLPSAAATDRPLATAARVFFGSAGAGAMAATALVSVYGYFTGAMLASPRLTFALAERGDFPKFFAAVHPKFRTPHVSIVAFGALAWLLAVWGTFRWNVTLSAVARLFTYAFVCSALPVLRRKQPGAAAFRLPAGRLFAAMGIAFSAVLVTRMGRAELLIIAATSAIALANWLWVRRRPAPSKT